ncbi:MAG TPA: toxin-antitoxin system YwqK family antitoxin [Chlamydiales bacterium]|nr:toxin-antitoxin system YwqK family antitoxin [Chlamydiales bacterium]
MKKSHIFLAASMLFSLVSCNNGGENNSTVSQKFIHKYGFAVSEKEWQERNESGKIITNYPNGVVQVSHYEQGKLHGESTTTYPRSNIFEKVLVYDEGSLIKETINDKNGIPFKENVFEFDNRKITTYWYASGVPASIEEYVDGKLMKGEYFNKNNTLESSITDGYGTRIKKDRFGKLCSKDLFEEGLMTYRTAYYPSGEVQSTTGFKNYALHGKQQSFSESGKLIMEANWIHGLIDGTKLVYKNNKLFKEIPYNMGKRHGIEKHYDRNGEIAAEIKWINDGRHGSCKFYYDDNTEIKWYYFGKQVSLDKYKMLELRDKLINELKSDAIVSTDSPQQTDEVRQ